MNFRRILPLFCRALLVGKRDGVSPSSLVGEGGGHLEASMKVAAQANWWPALDFFTSSLANTNTVLAKSSIRFLVIAVFLFVYITSKRPFTFHPHRSPISLLRLLSVPFKQRIGLPPLANSLSLSSSRPRRPTSPPFRAHSCLQLAPAPRLDHNLSPSVSSNHLVPVCDESST